jgi:hypothetical protein
VANELRSHRERAFPSKTRLPKVRDLEIQSTCQHILQIASPEPPIDHHGDVHIPATAYVCATIVVLGQLLILLQGTRLRLHRPPEIRLLLA